MNYFEINKISENEVFFKIIVPIIDDDVATNLRKKLYEILESDIKNITLSLHNVETLGSSGIGKLLLFNKELNNSGGSLKIIGLNEELTKTFKYLRLENIFLIE